MSFSLAIAPLAALAGDMPHAAGSPTAGITFDDRPLLLPVQRNFQMAMLTASSELGRSCGHMEAYGWRMAPNEQDRVNQIFNNTIDRMRAQGFMVESKSPTSVSRDVTIFTADRPDKHLLFMFSAGEIGLAMVLCQTSAPMAPTSRSIVTSTMTPPPSRGMSGSGGPGLYSTEEPLPLTRTGKRAMDGFSPLGEWVGTYTCHQGTTGGTLSISSLRGDQFEGTFRFYPTPKNPYVATGRYKVYGEYDSESQRILINPGKWLERPKSYYNTIMMGSFDPAARTFSGFFQGINGCTSFEAHRATAGDLIEGKKLKAAKHAKKPVKKKARKAAPRKVKQEAKPEVSAQPVLTAPETPTTTDKAVTGIKLGTQTATPTAPSPLPTASKDAGAAFKVPADAGKSILLPAKPVTGVTDETKKPALAPTATPLPKELAPAK
ncbi:MAG: hypothetical protein PHY92_05920 [Alphaproteobacteria bacterium]|nr:hypothetical protein [Alphaproteobacteria bacterium]